MHSGTEYGWALPSCVPTVALENISHLLISLDPLKQRPVFEMNMPHHRDFTVGIIEIRTQLGLSGGIPHKNRTSNDTARTSVITL